MNFFMKHLPMRKISFSVKNNVSEYRCDCAFINRPPFLQYLVLDSYFLKVISFSTGLVKVLFANCYFVKKIVLTMTSKIVIIY